jgi:hypothetical protein
MQPAIWLLFHLQMSHPAPTHWTISLHFYDIFTISHCFTLPTGLCSYLDGDRTINKGTSPFYGCRHWQRSWSTLGGGGSKHMRLCKAACQPLHSGAFTLRWPLTFQQKQVFIKCLGRTQVPWREATLVRRCVFLKAVRWKVPRKQVFSDPFGYPIPLVEFQQDPDDKMSHFQAHLPHSAPAQSQAKPPVPCLHSPGFRASCNSNTESKCTNTIHPQQGRRASRGAQADLEEDSRWDSSLLFSQP